MSRETVYLDPGRKLVEETVDWLLGSEAYASHVRDDDGAISLAHVMVVVPTAQSARNLRLMLARKAAASGHIALIPPRVVQPMQLVLPAEDELRTASPVELKAAFLAFVREHKREISNWTRLFRAEKLADFKSHLEFLDQLNDIWRILAGGGLLMREVGESAAARELLSGALGDELERWQELAELEAAFFGFLHARGLRHEVEAVHLAKLSARPIDESISEVVLPALVDPVSVIYNVLSAQREELKTYVLIHASPADAEKFDEWGRPIPEHWTSDDAPVLASLRDTDIVRASTNAELAKHIAADFPSAKAAVATPALGLCDAELFTDLASAFLSAGYELHNPEKHALSASSLGRIVDNLIALYRAKEILWKPFSALLRDEDVLTRVMRELSAEDASPGRSDVLAGMDVCRNTFFPRVFKDAFDETRVQHFERIQFAAFVRAAKTLTSQLSRANTDSVSSFVREMLGWVYSRRRATSTEDEFRAAAQATRDALDRFDEAIADGFALSDSALVGILRQTLAETEYSLEPDSPSAIRTEGWLELAWSDADKIALAGFAEGAVPDSTSGHAFLPDSLREALGLSSNARRLARDTYLLAELLASRPVDSVRAYFALADDAGDIRRPSRLLFLVPPSELAARAERLFGELPPASPLPARKIAEGWRLNLPDDPPPARVSRDCPEGRLSASAIDSWLKCPFTYLIEQRLELRRTEEKEELEANDFGTLVHLALEKYAQGELERSLRGEAQLSDETAIRKRLAEIMAELARAYGEKPAVKIRLQLDAATSRLEAFARLQAKWASEGWTIVEKPEYDFLARPFAGEEGCDLPIKGSIDRIDFKAGVGYRLIDYKTWDSAKGARSRILKGGEAEIAHAEQLGLPLVRLGASREARFLSVQLPLYAKCLETLDPKKFAGKIADWCYVLLGKTDADVVVMGSGELIEHWNTALDTARIAIRRMRGNVFWPPGPSEEWRWRVKGILEFSPERTLEGTEWLKNQKRRLAALHGEAAR